MKFARKFIFIAVACVSSTGAKAQVDCSRPSSTQLVCLLPYRTNASNSGATATNAANIFSGPIGAQLSQLPLAASAPGVVILSVGGSYKPYDNLGPILLDRPDSVGRGKMVLGFSAQQFNFNHLDGISIGSIPFTYQIPPSPGSQPQYYAQSIHAALKYNQYVLVATYGLPKKTDVSVILPFTRISIGVAAIDPVQYSNTAGVWNPNKGVLGVDKNGNPITTAYTNGSASGPGDLIINIKHVVWSGGEAGKSSLATGGALRVPTGDALNYLGSGAYGFNLYGLAAYKARVSPHVKVAYQWNSNSILLNLSGAPSLNQRLPGGLQTAVGADVAASSHFTVSADVLTNEFQNSPSISSPTSSKITLTDTQLTNGKYIQTDIATVNNVYNTFTTANLSAGVKWKPFLKQGLILYGNVLVQMNDVGLRSDPSPSGGISYNFRADKAPKWLYR